MWINRERYFQILKRLDALEEATYCPAAYSDTKIGRLLKMLLDHLGLHIERTVQHDSLAKKGGPERGDQA